MEKPNAGHSVATLFAAVGLLAVLLTALQSEGCAAPWETMGQGASTLYHGTLAALRHACSAEHFPAGDRRWRSACQFVHGLPETVGAEDHGGEQMVRVLPDGTVELQE